MQTFTTKISSHGRVVLPAELRNQMHLKDGDQLLIKLEGDVIHMFTLKQKIKEAQAIVKKYVGNKDLAAELKKIRKEDKTGE